ncbi:MAG: T9SS type A sorting domain-containing protein [candidate division Zixibacteria bacterium]|nr:T9SS type A sorting domain-containing protein [candidate division Zixibacteria bacterium]
MRKLFTIALMMVIAVAVSTFATIIDIPDDYPTIQQGINASIDGDTVLVQPGTYVENINFNGHNIVLGSMLLTTEDTSYIEQTVIDGDSSGSVVTFENGEGNETTITGFSITNGWNEGIEGGGVTCHNYSFPKIANNDIYGNYAYDGGGINCKDSNPTITDNNIFNNSNQFRGGGISCENSSPDLNGNYISQNEGSGIYCYLGSSPSITNNSFIENSGGGIRCRDESCPLVDGNVITNNSAQYGGGIYCRDSANPLIVNNIISGNTAFSDYLTGFGGGIYCEYSNPIIENNIISGNTAFDDYYDAYGGGIFCIESSPTISFNLIIENSAIGGNFPAEGGGICCFGNSEPIIRNNTIADNRADYGGGLYCENSNPSVVNTIFWADSASVYGNEFAGSSPDITYSNIQGGWDGEGNIDANPLFLDPLNGDFHLLAGSPCIDTGNPESPLDPDSTRADIGAFYYDQHVDIDVVDLLPKDFQLYQNYPNPFNGSTTISYDLPQAADVTIEIYDILGRRVETLISRNQPVGSHSLIWNAEDLTSGIYFYKLQAGNNINTKKMLLAK